MSSKIFATSKKYGDREILLDPEDVCKVSKFSWCYHKITKKNYFQIHAHVTISPLVYYKTRVHKVVLDIPPGEKKIVDHINGNTFDNRKSNLRICTHRENSRNASPQVRKKTSRYKGVYWDKYRNKWCAQLHIRDGKGVDKHIYLGRFVLEEDAAKAYDAKAELLFGEFARKNFP